MLAQHRLLTKVQELLEYACYEFSCLTTPAVLWCWLRTSLYEESQSRDANNAIVLSLASTRRRAESRPANLTKHPTLQPQYEEGFVTLPCMPY